MSLRFTSRRNRLIIERIQLDHRFRYTKETVEDRLLQTTDTFFRQTLPHIVKHSSDFIDIVKNNIKNGRTGEAIKFVEQIGGTAESLKLMRSFVDIERVAIKEREENEQKAE